MFGRSRPYRPRVVRSTPCIDPLEDRSLAAALGHLDAPTPSPPVPADVALAQAPSTRAAWKSAAPLPLARTEVAAATVRGEILVIGGIAEDGTRTGRVDAYSPRLDRWRRLPDLPVPVDHAAAASVGGRLFVVGGYVGPSGTSRLLRGGFEYEGGRWLALPEPPEARAASGAAIVNGRLQVVGGVGPSGLATTMLVYDIGARTWSTGAGPTPREHLAVAALGGRVFALGGRLSGLDTNLDLLESFSPRVARWRSLPPVPEARGGTGAVAVGGSLVSVGGEGPIETIGSVYAYSVAAGRWRRLADLPTPRHGLGMAAAAGRFYAIGGGPRPGLSVSDANEFLRLS